MFLKVLEIKFKVIVFSEIGAWSIGTVEHLLPNHDFYFVLLFENKTSSASSLWKQLRPMIKKKKKKRGNLINKGIRDGVTFRYILILLQKENITNN